MQDAIGFDNEKYLQEQSAAILDHARHCGAPVGRRGQTVAGVEEDLPVGLGGVHPGVVVLVGILGPDEVGAPVAVVRRPAVVTSWSWFQT